PIAARTDKSNGYRTRAVPHSSERDRSHFSRNADDSIVSGGPRISKLGDESDSPRAARADGGNRRSHPVPCLASRFSHHRHEPGDRRWLDRALTSPLLS